MQKSRLRHILESLKEGTWEYDRMLYFYTKANQGFPFSMREIEEIKELEAISTPNSKEEISKVNT